MKTWIEKMAGVKELRLLGKILFVIFLLFHVLAIFWGGIVPPKSALAKSLSPLLQPYLNATGNRSYWGMFSSRPRFHDFQVSLIARDAQGTNHTLGPLLPGLRVFEGELRSYKFFTTLARPNAKQHRRVYLADARRAAEERLGRPIRRVWLRYELHWLNDLETIRKSGRTSHLEVQKLGH